MTDKNFFYEALGLFDPWTITSIELDTKAETVVVNVGIKKKTKWAQDGKLLPIHDYTTRSWRHLDTMQLETTIVAKVPRVRYPDGTTGVVPVPWAGTRSRWSTAFERKAICVIQVCSSLSAACRLLDLGWKAADSIMKRAVERGLERREIGQIKTLGMDDKSFRKRHRYGTLVNDLENGIVLEVVETREAQAAKIAVSVLGSENLGKVEAVAIDMSSTYENVIREMCPNAAVVYDKWHVFKLLSDAVDKVRRDEHRELLVEGDKSLKGTRYHWLQRIENMAKKTYESFLELSAKAYRTAKAWEYRFLFEGFWEQPSKGTAATFFEKWFRRAVRSKLPPVVAAARTLKRHLTGLLAYFEYRITNAVSEGLNSRIEAIKNSARGFHSFETFRIRILFFLGGLELKPR